MPPDWLSEFLNNYRAELSGMNLNKAVYARAIYYPGILCLTNNI